MAIFLQKNGFRLLVVGLLLLSLILPSIAPPYYLDILVYAGINEFSMGHAGFMSIGAYVSATLTTIAWQGLAIAGLPTPLSDGIFFTLALLAGGLAAAGLGYLVGLPSLRLRGDYLALVTLGFGEIVRVIILNIPAVGGARGLPGIPKWSGPGSVMIALVICFIVIRRLMRSGHGRAWLAIREDEIAAQAMGVPTTRYKVLAFVIGAFFAGVAGGLFGHYLMYINPKTFDFNRSFEIIIMVVLGGMGSVSGVAISAVLLTVLKEVLRPENIPYLQQFTSADPRMVLFALILIALMLTRPNGLFGRKELGDILFRKRERRHD